MAVDSEHADEAAASEAQNGSERSRLRRLGNKRIRRRLLSQFGRIFGTYVLSSLTRRIIAINLVGLLALVIGILYLNQFRAGLIDARVQSLSTQGEIIAGAIAASATVDTGTITVDPERLLELQAGESITPTQEDLESLDFPINPERVGPVLRRLISPTKTRARIYDPEGILILDSRHLYTSAQILRFDLPPPNVEEEGFWDGLWQWTKRWLRQGDLPIYQEVGGGDGRTYPEVEAALAGSPATVTRISQHGELIVSVAVPIQRFRAVLGALLLSTQGGDIDAIVRAERIAIIRVFLFAATVTILLSILLAGTIAGPVRRLAAAADRVRRGSTSREEIPDFSDRQDEIGHLARSFREMTHALYNKIDAIEQFAADVAHELKNPLTSLRSAVETLPLAKSENSKDRLMEVIQHDVRRLDRLISDISDASRLDAELARIQSESIDLAEFLRNMADAANQRTTGVEEASVKLTVADAPGIKPYLMQGHDIRLGQVISNLLDNARSFSPADGTVRVDLSRDGRMIKITVDDDGPGIRAENTERIFERFYTDRPDGEGFGNNSGLGLSISRQIIEAHGGTIAATNRLEPKADGSQKTVGARFTIRLPVGPVK
ncbi:sensor histidine kinase [Roseibium sediminicola]|uniref:histidine kinase n=1 Tax=Roseibium sediminicola TaxID=2933272 RepID=A0ABT0GVG4_9HYPH|nr:sensor histidine kinase [Roseibium sp. CAU 1639]MCK7613426.1 sensor histidine kinase [Roseibium sp. CAU 1639]